MPDFVDGLFAKAPNEKAPDFVKGRLSIKRDEFATWLAGQTEEWINLDIKVSKGGKWYTQVNDWKPEGKPQGTQNDGPERAFTPPAAPAQPNTATAINVDEIPF